MADSYHDGGVRDQAFLKKCQLTIWHHGKTDEIAPIVDAAIKKIDDVCGLSLLADVLTEK